MTKTLPCFPLNDKQINIPSSNCEDRKQLIDFALSFNAYQYIDGGTNAVSDLYKRVKELLLNHDGIEDVSLEDLRCCLFWRQRANRWNYINDIEEYQYWVNLIRKKCNL